MDQRARRISSIAGATLAAVVALGGCSSDTDSDSEKKSTASGSPAADEKKPDSDASASSPASAADRTTPEGAVAAWVTAVIKQQPKDACLVMAEPAKGSTPAKVGSEETCGDDAPDRKQIDATVKQLGESFTPEPPSADPKVEVAKASAAGDTVEYPADKITVDGQTLEKIVLSHSTGVTADQLDIKVQSSKIEDSWYVTNLDFDLG
ncbi:hypothetical protein ACIOKD_25930 [Streptomyces sp. NPDC087844]|uniref:hypothetical protein n=1 Tax=Streptomyces sp. NPDC087844 TaxID=3365805 RepID=UPI0037F38985